MTGKKALERLRADPALRTRENNGYWPVRWANGREECLRNGEWVPAGVSIADATCDFTLVRCKAKELRNVFEEPRPGDVVEDPKLSSSEFTYKVFGSMWPDCVNLYRGDIFCAAFTRAEFAARAKAPFNWKVIKRAEG